MDQTENNLSNEELIELYLYKLKKNTTEWHDHLEKTVRADGAMECLWGDKLIWSGLGSILTHTHLLYKIADYLEWDGRKDTLDAFAKALRLYVTVFWILTLLVDNNHTIMNWEGRKLPLRDDFHNLKKMLQNKVYHVYFSKISDTLPKLEGLVLEVSREKQ